MSKGKKVGEYRPVPGVESAELLKLRSSYIPKALYQVLPVFIARGKGALVEDVDGNEYLDFVAGIGALVTGHCYDGIISAIKEQADKYLHTDFNVLMYESYVTLAKKLAEITPGNYAKQVVFKNGGSEAIEDAVKIARKYTRRQGLIAFEGGFHGRTQMALALTSQWKNYKMGIGPFDPWVYRFPYPYAYRAPFDLGEDAYADYCVQKIEDSFKSYLAAEEIAAVILEPVLGIGGHIMAPPAFMKGLRKLCDRHGIMLVVDEIFSGMGRTGKMWGVEHSGVVPDILVAGKGLGGGMILSATVAKKELFDVFDMGGLGGTFPGHPLCCVAALKVIEVLEQDGVLQSVNELGNLVKGKLQGMKEKYDLIGDVRCVGLSIGLELVKDRKSKEPAAQETKSVLSKCHERGLILTSTGELKNIVRIIPPLLVKKDELEQGLAILEAAIKAVCG